jgi:hypothetical protein
MIGFKQIEFFYQTGILNYLESTGTNRRLPMNPPYVSDFFVQYDARTPGQTITDGFPNFAPTPNGPQYSCVSERA